MRWVAILLVGCVALAALQYVLAALVIALLLLILWGAIVHPAETLGALGFFLLASIVVNHTLATLAVVGFLGFLLIVCGQRAPSGTSAEKGSSEEVPPSD